MASWLFSLSFPHFEGESTTRSNSWRWEDCLAQRLDMLFSFFDVHAWFIYVTITTYIKEHPYINFVFKYHYYLIKVCMLDPECISSGFALTLWGFLSNFVEYLWSSTQTMIDTPSISSLIPQTHHYLSLSQRKEIFQKEFLIYLNENTEMHHDDVIQFYIKSLA